MNSLPLSRLCRRRHNPDYADLWIMPTSPLKEAPLELVGAQSMSA